MDFLHRLSKHLGIESEEELARMTREPSFDFIPRIDEEPAVKTAVGMIRRAMSERRKILVYGDYDTDGFMATSIIVRCFHKLHYGASFYIPTRAKDGYGLTLENAKKIASAGYGLVILVDNGVTCLDQVSYLLSRGIETIIIDHHDLPASLPPAGAIIHDKLLQYGDYPVSAGYLCALFSLALLGEKDDYLLTLGAISLVSDLMPIRSHNRTLLALALRYIRANRYPEIMMLTTHMLVDEKTLGMEIIPKINAIGRLVEDHSCQRVVHYFADIDNVKKAEIAAWMGKVNELRKTATAEAASKIKIDPACPANVIVANISEGLNGLVANNVMHANMKPTVIFTTSQKDPSCYIGSARSSDGFDITEAFKALRPYIVQSGGHPRAGGLTIKKEDYPVFREEFIRLASKNIAKKKETKAMEIDLSECNMESFRAIRALGPYGMDYPEPVFRLNNLRTDTFQYVRDGERLSTPLGNKVKLFSFHNGKSDFGGPYANLDVKFSLNDYRGEVTLCLYAEKVEE